MLYQHSGKLYKLNEKGVELEVCQEVQISHVLSDLHSNDKVIYLKLILKNEEVEFAMERGRFTKIDIINELLRKGLSINSWDTNALIQYLFYLEESAPKYYQHHKLGFHKVNDHLLYLASKTIGGEVTSTYVENEKLLPRGTYEMWLNIINHEVIGYPALEFALTIGYSAIVVGRLSALIGFSNLLFLFYNDTSLGKTTALKLMASIYGNPSIGRNGIVNTFDATHNALINLMCDKCGFPVLLDEAMMNNRTGWEDLIYRIEGGTEKNRLSKDLIARNQREWRTTVVMTSEVSMLENSAKHGGLRCRLFEVKRKFTASAEHSNRIVDGISQNYGHAVIPFANFLIGLKDDEMIQLYHTRRNALSDKLRKRNSLSSRIIEKLAVISVTASIMNTNIGLKVNEESIDKEIISIHDSITRSFDIAVEALEFFKSWISENKRQFHHEILPQYRNAKNTHFNGSFGVNSFGKILIDNKENVLEVLILTKKFQEVFERSTFPKIQTILQAWREKGILIGFDPGRLDTKRTINGIRSRVYIIQFAKEDSSYPTYEDKKAVALADNLFCEEAS